MFQPFTPTGDREQDYTALSRSLSHLLAGETDRTANLANAAALLDWFLTDVNWAGFYLLDAAGEQLVLGPFQGLPACVRIPLGKGVCGTAAAGRRTVVVPDVREFPGHIACDDASLSEIVVPLVRDGELIGVLDVDSPRTARFDRVDARGLESFAGVLTAAL